MVVEPPSELITTGYICGAECGSANFGAIDLKSRLGDAGSSRRSVSVAASPLRLGRVRRPLPARAPVPPQAVRLSRDRRRNGIVSANLSNIVGHIRERLPAS